MSGTAAAPIDEIRGRQRNAPARFNGDPRPGLCQCATLRRGKRGHRHEQAENGSHEASLQELQETRRMEASRTASAPNLRLVGSARNTSPYVRGVNASAGRVAPPSVQVQLRAPKAGVPNDSAAMSAGVPRFWTTRSSATTSS